MVLRVAVLLQLLLSAPGALGDFTVQSLLATQAPLPHGVLSVISDTDVAAQQLPPTLPPGVSSVTLRGHGTDLTGRISLRGAE